jgi:ElaB/YqjD/DUF883 family membrane-anchored ribosome-binding protein
MSREARAAHTEVRTGVNKLEKSIADIQRREAARVLKRISVSAGESWRDAKRAADSILHEARTTAASVVDRFRHAVRA